MGDVNDPDLVKFREQYGKKKNTTGDSASDTTDSTSNATPYTVTLQPFMGNNMELLAQQLSAGYGAPMADYMTRMQTAYAPFTNYFLKNPDGSSPLGSLLKDSGKGNVTISGWKKKQDG